MRAVGGCVNLDSAAQGGVRNSKDHGFSSRTRDRRPLHRPSGWTFRPLKRRLSPE